MIHIPLYIQAIIVAGIFLVTFVMEIGLKVWVKKLNVESYCESIGMKKANLYWKWYMRLDKINKFVNTLSIMGVFWVLMGISPILGLLAIIAFFLYIKSLANKFANQFCEIAVKSGLATYKDKE